MIIRLFDVQNGVVVPTEHCYTLKALKDIMDKYPEDYLKVYQYLFYMTCPNPDLNPFFYMIDGFRYGFFGQSDTSPYLSLMIVLSFFIILSFITIRMLKSGYKLRN